MLIHIKKFCDDHKDIQITCTGDENQLEPIDTIYRFYKTIKHLVKINNPLVLCTHSLSLGQIILLFDNLAKPPTAVSQFPPIASSKARSA